SSHRVRWSRVSSSDAQRRAVSLVLGQWFTNCAANDSDEQRPVQRTCRRIPAIDLVLIGRDLRGQKGKTRISSVSYVFSVDKRWKESRRPSESYSNYGSWLELRKAS